VLASLRTAANAALPLPHSHAAAISRLPCTPAGQADERATTFENLLPPLHWQFTCLLTQCKAADALVR